MTSEAKSPKRGYLAGLALGAMGVVYGDIGTSPLYAIHQCFAGTHPLPVYRANVLGVLSLIFWSLILIVSVKYLIFVMRAQNKGEGGILALMALAFPEKASRGRFVWIFMMLGVFGATLLYGDGMITPAITVLSAIEGLKVATPKLEPYVIPITTICIIGLFSFQNQGTGKVGKAFGPVMLVWFTTLAILGIKGIIQAPEVLKAINPYHAIHFFMDNGWVAFPVLGSVFLVLTGAEALYADMGHFGIQPIRMAWCFVLPALLLNYFGQGALIFKSPELIDNPFYHLAPRWALYPLVGLATFASIIASQALISGAFSVTMQAIQLGYFPRMEITHTSHQEKGQIYMPHINWFLMLASIGLVIGFKNSDNLAAAYGIAVTMTMLITTILFYFASQRLWGWSKMKAAWLCIGFFILELAFFGANTLKIVHGGWFPLLVAIFFYTLMSTWKRGRQLLRERLSASLLPYDLFVKSVQNHPPVRVKGTAIFMAGNPDGVPIALLHNLKHNKILHERVITLTIITEEVPHVERERRVEIEELHEGIYRVVARYGFMEEPHVPQLLKVCGENGLKVRAEESTFFLSRETIIATRSRPGMAIWREKLFAFMARNAGRAATFFHIPSNRVVELGMQVEM